MELRIEEEHREEDQLLQIEERSPEYYSNLIHDLRALPSESELVEFKVNLDDAEIIGRNISALANTAALRSKPSAYMVWGVENETHTIVGTDFDPDTAKWKKQPLELWLSQMLHPKPHFLFQSHEIAGKTVVVLEVSAAAAQPVRFRSQRYIRVGSSTTSLADYTEKERRLWSVLDTTPFEVRSAENNVSGEEVLRLLDYQGYCALLEKSVPAGQSEILAMLERDKLAVGTYDGHWNITNFGALMFARDLADFPGLWRKAVRIICYQGEDRLGSATEFSDDRGYAIGFKTLIEHLESLMPDYEVIEHGRREYKELFPKLAVRELVVNAMIHQDLTMTGVSPIVSLFNGRVEIGSPGVPLVDIRRFVDTEPVSRNEMMASMMRRLQYAEERGSGIGKVITATEQGLFPPPWFEKKPNATVATLFVHKPLREMDWGERVRASYFHACVLAKKRQYLTNASLRVRFGVEEKNKAAVSRYIKEAVDANLIKPVSGTSSRRLMQYLPFWAEKF